MLYLLKLIKQKGVDIFMDELNQKVQSIVRDNRQYIKSWFFDTEAGQVVFRGHTGNEFRLGYASIASLPHSTISEWLRQSVQGVVK